MCGRYQRRADKQRIAEAFALGNIEGLAMDLDLAPNYNVAPGTMQPVIISDPDFGTRTLRMMFWRYLPGRLYPVNPIAVRNVEGLFTVNERLAVTIDSDDMGRVCVVMVGATNVGRMTLSFAPLQTNTGAPAVSVRLAEPLPVKRGDELGAFNLGSTVVLLAADPRLQPAGVREGDIVRVGQALWRI